MNNKIKKEKAKKTLIKVFIAIAYGLIFSALSFSVLFSDSGTHVDDIILQRGIDANEDVVIVGISSDDVKKYDAMPGEVAAMVALELNGDGAPAAIGVDIPTADITEKAEESFLTADKLENNLVLPVTLKVRESYNYSSYGAEQDAAVATDVITPSQELSAAVDLGHNMLIADENGTIRHATLDVSYTGGRTYSNMAELCFKKYCGYWGVRATDNVTCTNTSGALIKFAPFESLHQTYSATQVIEGLYEKGSVEGKIVLIGYYDTALTDMFITAYDYNTVIPPVLIDANTVNCFMNNGFAVCVPLMAQILILVFAVTVLILIFDRIKPVPGIIACLIYAIFVIVIHTLLNGMGLRGCVLPHILNALINGGAMALIVTAKENRRKKSEIERIMSTYLDTNIVRGIISDKITDESQSELQAKKKDKSTRTAKIAVLFADVRSFTTISEKLSPETLAEMLNELLSMMAECVERYGGTLDKFIGDCAMAYWGAPEDDDEACYHACLCAYEMQRRAKDLEKSLHRIAGMDVKIGIGINYGEAIVGDVGSLSRLNYTAVGDTVNTASRIEGQTPGGEIYISESVEEKLGVYAECEKLGKLVKLKGKEKEINLYSLKTIAAKDKVMRKDSNSAKSAKFKRRNIICVIIDIIIILAQMVFVIFSLANNGIGYVIYFPVVLSMVVGLGNVYKLSQDFKAAVRADGFNNLSRWGNILALLTLVSNIAIGIILVFFPAVREGINWNGDILLIYVCPPLALFSYLVLDSRYRYKISDLFFATLPIGGLMLVFSFLCKMLGFDVINPVIYNKFYVFPHYLYFFGIAFAVAVIASVLNNLMRLQDRVDISRLRIVKKIKKIFSGGGEQGQLKKNRIRVYVIIIMNIILALICIKPVIAAYVNIADSNKFSIPILCSGDAAFAAMIVAAAYFFSVVRKKSKMVEGLSKNIAFARNLAAAQIFITICGEAINKQSLAVLFTPLYELDFTIYLITPLLCVILSVLENHRYKFYQCMLWGLPFIINMYLSKAALEGEMGSITKFDYSVEYDTYFKGGVFYAMIGLIFACAAGLFVISRLINKTSVHSNPDARNICFYACGVRNGISSSSYGIIESKYGVHSECYVLRDGAYAIVINAGSGIQNAVKRLNGCKRVDVILTTADFGNIMGFLAVPNICPGAKIRIFSAFDMSKFSENPYWPVNIISAQYIQIKKGQRVKLNENTVADFVKADDFDENLLVRINGSISLCYISKTSALPGTLKKWVQGSDVLIYDGYDDYPKGCFLAIDCSVPNLLISGYPSDATDDTLDGIQAQAAGIISIAKLMRENDDYYVAERK